MPYLRAAKTSLAALSAATASGALALVQSDGPPPEPPVSTVERTAATTQGSTYEPAYFAQYSPRNALDMVEQVPGFNISGNSDGQRGLGQASQNVLVNGERFSSKSDSVRDQLQRIPAGDVVRIEIVDGTTLDIPGLTGQVANVVTASTGASGQFTYRAGFRAYNTEAQYHGGEASVTGSAGDLSYTLAIDSTNNRFGADGPIFITDGAGALVERQNTKFSGGFDNPTLSTNFTYRPSNSVVANLNLRYGVDYFFRNEPEAGVPVAGPVRTRLATVRENGPEYELGGDVEFPLGPGTMKLIGLERFERDNFESVVIDRFDDATPTDGNRFTQTNESGERIGRFEYGWRMFAADWQLAGEAAFNRLDRVSGLFALDGDDRFFAIPFPAGTGGVQEDRYEAILSFSKQLTGTLAFQATGGGEYSRIEQTGAAANSRNFQRPKGSLSLAWRPRPDLDSSIKLSREVGQLSFGDFLASVALNDDNENAGNNTLEPSQSWFLSWETNKRLGLWGSINLELAKRWSSDFIDFFPQPGGGEARGNIGDATAARVETDTTIKFDPLGWTGAQINLRAAKLKLRVIDPFTGEARPFSRNTIDFIDVDFRHDITGSDWAYGASLFSNENAPYSRRFEIGRDYEGPAFFSIFLEHKDVLGLTVNARAGNLLGARQKFERTVFASSRPSDDILFREVFSRRIGPIFNMSLSGNF